MNKWLLSFFIIGVVFLSLAAVSQSENEDEDDAVVATEEEDPVVEDIIYTSPTPSGSVYFAEHFDDVSQFIKKWVLSDAKKDDIDDDIAKYDGKWEIDAPQKNGLTGDLGLVLISKAKHAAISARLDRPFKFTIKPLIVQYEVTFQEGQECGGAYLKLLTHGKHTADLRHFHDKTPYTIMFGPDKCGNDHKLHFIFRHKNPLNGTFSEKHCKKPKERLEEPFKDKLPHLYTLVVQPDNTFTVKLDHKVINEGNLLDDFTPPVNPPPEIDDPDDKKPSDWDEREKIPDPEARKPDDWDEDAPAMIPDPAATKPDSWLEDEPEMIPDPNAEKPDDWDSDMDGDWEPPLIPNPICESAPGCGSWKPPQINNPDYKGKWRAPLIDNPNYKGKWKPRRIPNPDFFEDKDPFRMTDIAAVGLELWSMSNMILFDNFIITDDQTVADTWASETFDLKRRKLDKDGVVIYRVAEKSPYPYLTYHVDLYVHTMCRGTPLRHKCFGACHTEHGGTSGCVPNMMVRIQIHLMYSDSHHMATLWGKVMKTLNYKPGWWALYFVYCAIPIGIYVCYLWKRVSEESLFSRLVTYTNEHPWLWAVYVIVIGLPIVLVLVFCCGSSSQEKEEQRRAAEAKKTDAVSPDDDVDQQAPTKATKSKSQLEVQEEEEEEEEVVEEAEASGGELDTEAPKTEEAVPEGAEDSPSSPKKHASRKEE